MATHKETIIQRFDNAAPTYSTQGHVQEVIADWLITLPPDKVGTILEIGCGVGTLTKHLIKRYPTATITATDIAPSMIKAAKCASNAPVKWGVLDGESISLPHSYDLIISNMSAQWFTDIKAAYASWQNHLNPGGRVLSTRPADNTFPEWRETLSKLQLQSGLHPYQTSNHEARRLTHIAHYRNTMNFLRSMRATGATTPRTGYTPLSPAELKRACAQCDSLHNGQITWNIVCDEILS